MSKIDVLRCITVFTVGLEVTEQSDTEDVSRNSGQGPP